MKAAIAFLLAFAVTALTVSGQEDAETDLLNKIAALQEALKARLARNKAPQDNFIIRRIYDIADLTARKRDRSLHESNLIPSKYQPPEQAEDAEPYAHFETDSLIELIRMSVEPASWDTIEGANIEPKNGALFVTNLARVHTKIADFLTRTRKAVGAQVVIDVVAVPVTDETAALLDQRPRELSDDEAGTLRAAGSLGTVRLVGFDGQKCTQRSGTHRSYLADYDVEIAQDADIGDPERQQVFEGFAAEVLPCLDRGAAGLVLHCRLQRTRVKDPIRRRETEHGALDLPVMELTRVNTSLWAPLGRTVIVGGATGGDNPCVFLLTARLVE